MEMGDAGSSGRAYAVGVVRYGPQGRSRTRAAWHDGGVPVIAENIDTSDPDWPARVAASDWAAYLLVRRAASYDEPALRGHVLACMDTPVAHDDPAVAAWRATGARKLVVRARPRAYETLAALARTRCGDGPGEVCLLGPYQGEDGPAVLAREQLLRAPCADTPSPQPTGPRLQLGIPADPAVSLGKFLAQCGHAGQVIAAVPPDHARAPVIAAWRAAGRPSDVVRLSAEQIAVVVRREACVRIHDAGLHEGRAGVSLVCWWTNRDEKATHETPSA